VEDDKRPGRPVTMETDGNVEKVRTLVRTDRRLDIRFDSGGVEYGQRNDEKILTTILNMKDCGRKWSQRIREF
jgi:hypothetical protein